MVHTFNEKKWSRNSFHFNRIADSMSRIKHGDEPDIYSKEYLRRLLEKNRITSTYFDNFDESSVKIPNTTHQHYMDQASKVALLSPMQHKHGCVIVDRNKITGKGFNKYSEISSKHAEKCAITSAMGGKSSLESSTMYVVRIAPTTYGNVFKYSKPCETCQRLIDKTKIKKVYYSTSHEYDIERDFNNINIHCNE
jgi:deoxycytidylate deaminase